MKNILQNKKMVSLGGLALLLLTVPLIVWQGLTPQTTQQRAAGTPENPASPVAPVANIGYSTKALPSGRVGVIYDGRVNAYDDNGQDKLTMKIEGLPQGLTPGTCTEATNPLNNRRSISCLITGTPTVASSSNVVVTTTDSTQRAVVRTYMLSIHEATGPVISSVTPISGKFMDTITLSGARFGTSGSVNFYNRYNQASGGAPIVSWSTSSIKFTVPAIAGFQTYSVQVRSNTNEFSNTIVFAMKEPQPYIGGIAPANVAPNGQITITGADFGTTVGAVNFYLPGSQSASGGSVITSWAATSIRANVPGIIGKNRDYLVEVVTSDGRKSSMKVYSVGPQIITQPLAQ